MTGKPLTGRKVFAITASAFAVIIGVNLFMAWQAIHTFPGLEVDNSYVASQSFDDDRDAQQALGWDTALTSDRGELVLTITDASGLPAQVATLDATLGRATHVRDDFAPDFVREAGAFRAPVDLAPGYWHLRFTATAPDGTEFRQRLELYVKGG